ncbi:AraC family transcriptional regulator N-terminal domain-containing protein [Curtobacterium sp. C2H10]|uniref:AraC family transcriptional regulator n=1 Tax=Curtobacterium sp. C2H10 TaxID=2736664 RepID=UPI0021C00DB9|nr:AraC family transcriptional regulator N-terminal domain-containing protein [Curtobacterium sp. C2H10]MCT9620879.1 AraC family transcriptional regulator N-terminal domain-containing protein [Curtobacterium sp. C2H10]
MDDRAAQHLDRAVEVASRHAAVLDRASTVDTVARPASVQRAEALGLTVSRVHEPTGLFDRRYVPSLSVVLRGRKRSIVGDDDQVWGRERFIITPVDLPVVAGVIDTAGSNGFVSAVWKLDPVVVGEVVASMSSTTTSTSSTDLPRLGTWTAPLADAVSRLLALLDAPEDIPVLFPLVSREVVLRLLQTAQAPRITAALDRAGADAGLVTAATALLTGRMDEPWTMERLARELRVSESTLFARFKQATGMSPAQYLKRTRLGEARRRMVLHADTAARAAAAVGYRSASHFSRDYREAYGRPPAADAVVAREQLALAPAV